MSAAEPRRGKGAPANAPIASPDRCARVQHDKSDGLTSIDRRSSSASLPIDAPRPAPFPLVPSAPGEISVLERAILERARSRQAGIFDTAKQRSGHWIEGAVRVQLRHWFQKGLWDVAQWTRELSQRYPHAFVARIERGAVRRLHMAMPDYKVYRQAAMLCMLLRVAQLDLELNLTVVVYPSDSCPGNAWPQPEPRGISCPLECETNSTRAIPFGGARARAHPACAAPRPTRCKCGKYVEQPSTVSVLPGLEEARLPLPVLCFQKDAQNREAALLPEMELLMGQRGKFTPDELTAALKKRRGKAAPQPPRLSVAQANASPRVREARAGGDFLRGLEDVRTTVLRKSYPNRGQTMLQYDVPWTAKSGGAAYFAGTASGHFEGLLNQRARVCSAHQLLAKPPQIGAAHGTEPVPDAQSVSRAAHALIRPLTNRSGLLCRLTLASCTSGLEQLGQCADGSALAKGPRTTWADALRHKYILSMDGNGATCSRVYLALLSGSVLLKLEASPPLLQPSSLYFHSALRAWEHFVPVTEANIGATVAWLDAHDDVAQSISAAGSAFAREEYTDAVAVRYTHFLLHALAQLHRATHGLSAGGAKPFFEIPIATAPHRNLDHYALACNGQLRRGRVGPDSELAALLAELD